MLSPTIISKISGRSRNLILSRLSEDQFGDLSRHLLPVDLPNGMRLGEPNQANKFVYLPISGLVSVNALTEGGESVEVGVVGREGLIGIAGLLGLPQMSHSVVVHAAGSGLRIRTSIVRDEFLRGREFASLVQEQLYLNLLQASQTALCNRLHPVDARMARWMLTASDRLASDMLIMTQELLAQLLGARRSTVTVAAGLLQRQGLIDSSRGRIKILDRPGLEAVACECYGIVRATFRRVLGAY